jgi:mono/diheme cytochrome c family protein
MNSGVRGLGNTALALCLGAGLAAAGSRCADSGVLGQRSASGTAATEVSPAVRGRTLFGAYCESCHGVNGQGGGAGAQGLRVAPADLTAISKRAGRFDPDRVAAYIDGRQYIAEHGPREMPVWGRQLDDRLERSLSEESRLGAGMISDIVAYVETLQVR